jgi:hypothetical protein
LRQQISTHAAQFQLLSETRFSLPRGNLPLAQVFDKCRKPDAPPHCKIRTFPVANTVNWTAGASIKSFYNRFRFRSSPPCVRQPAPLLFARRAIASTDTGTFAWPRGFPKMPEIQRRKRRREHLVTQPMSEAVNAAAQIPFRKAMAAPVTAPPQSTFRLCRYSLR